MLIKLPALCLLLLVSAIAVLSGLPGALMILSPVVLFKAHGTAALAWGLTPLEDQQIAGLIMWLPAGIFFLAPIAWRFVKSFDEPEKRRALASVIVLLALCAVPVVVSGCSMAQSDTKGASSRGKRLIGQYGCGTCHNIPGIDGAVGRVGPPLGGIGDRIFIAGRLQNSTDNLTKWISDPQSVDPGNAMPNMGIKPTDARTIAAYLETLREPK